MPCELVTRRTFRNEMDPTNWGPGDVVEVRENGLRWGLCDPMYEHFYHITVLDKDREEMSAFMESVIDEERGMVHRRRYRIDLSRLPRGVRVALANGGRAMVTYEQLRMATKDVEDGRPLI